MDGRTTGRITHVRCGDDIAAALGQAELGGTFVRWADPLCEGPCPAGLEGEAFRAVRSAWLSRRLGLPEAEIAADLADQDAKLAESAENAGELVLWFEHDLFDQIILVHLLRRLRPAWETGVPISLVCIGDHPSVARFRGLGQLTPEHFPPLFDARRPVPAEAFDLAARAWGAFTAPDPAGLVAMVEEGTPALPFLKAALDRHLRQFPWRADGLALTEWLALDVIDLGVDTPETVFAHVQAREEAPWQGDILFFAWLKELAQGPDPLLEVEGNDWPRGVRVHLTDRARSVLLGRAEALDGRPLDRWLGGVHLTGCRPPWRWDANRSCLMSST